MLCTCLLFVSKLFHQRVFTININYGKITTKTFRKANRIKVGCLWTLAWILDVVSLICVCTVKLRVVTFVLYPCIPLSCLFTCVLLFCLCVSGLWSARGRDKAVWGPGVPAAGEREQAGRGEGDPYTAASSGDCWLPAEHCHSQGNSCLCVSPTCAKNYIPYTITILFFVRIYIYKWFLVKLILLYLALASSKWCCHSLSI